MPFVAVQVRAERDGDAKALQDALDGLQQVAKTAETLAAVDAMHTEENQNEHRGR